MNRKFLSISLLAALTVSTGLVLTGSTPVPEARAEVASVPAGMPDPAAQIVDLAQMLRANDIAGLARAAVPPSKWAEVQMAHEFARLQPISEEDRAEFEANIARLTGDGAVDALMAEIEPKLAELRPQVPGALLMGFGALQMAITSPDSELTDEQRASIEAAFPALQEWAVATDFLDAGTMRRALTMLANAARNTGVDDIDALRALPLDDALHRAGPVLAAAKDAVRLYGLDLDAIIDTLHVEVIEVAEETARIRATITAFAAPFSIERELVLVEGRWYPKEAAEHWIQVNVMR